LDIVQLLYNKVNANLLVKDDRGVSPLLLAERNGHSHVVAWLLEQVIAVFFFFLFLCLNLLHTHIIQPEVPWDDVDHNGMSLLMVAAERGDAGLVRDICLTTRCVCVLHLFHNNTHTCILYYIHVPCC
jgi:ankyrin repeat protein